MNLKINGHIIQNDLSKILSELTQITHYNFKQKKTNDNYMICCPFHSDGKEDHQSCGVVSTNNLKSTVFGSYNCFACGSKGMLWHLVAAVLKCSDEKAKQWLIENFTSSIEADILDLPEFDVSKPKKQYLDESILNSFQSYHPYMTQRKLSRRIIEVFKIKYDPKSQCIVFPVYDEHNKLFMLTRRSVNSKMFIIDKDKEKPLYLLNYIKEHNIQECVITEGQIDALTACTYGMPAVATMGSISDHQLDLINKSGIRILYAMFDNDKAGISFYNKLKNRLKKSILLINVPILIIGKKDINDLSQDEFWNCIESAKNSA